VLAAYGEKLPIPEIVAIGGQSDGKSSLLEAFLGFRFNVRQQPPLRIAPPGGRPSCQHPAISCC